MIGQSISHYEILRKLGEGGMGVVYQARDTRLMRTVALKFLPAATLAGEAEKTRFLGEARAAAALSHPNICTVYEVNEHQGEPFIVMEYVEGKSLKQLLSENGPLSIDQCVAIAGQIAAGLRAAHEKGIVHRDIKPANILILKDGQVKIMDFGLARTAANPAPPQAAASASRPAGEISSSPGTSYSTFEGTLAYMSPEHIDKLPLDARADIFALGTVLYELVTGRLPFNGDDALAIMTSILQDTPASPATLRPAVPKPVAALVLKALAKSPGDRFQNMLEMQRALEKLEGLAAAKRSRKMALIAAGVPLGVLLTAALAFWLFPPPAPISSPPLPLQVRGLSLTPHTNAWPTFSPDARHIAYLSLSSDSGGTRILMKNLENGTTTTLLQDEAMQLAGLEWCPDGSRIAGYLENTGGICLFETAGPQGYLRVTDFGYSPRWAPDGRKIVFSSLSPFLVWERNEIWIFDLADSSLRRVSPRNGLSFDSPSWSADQRWIACLAGVGSQKALWLLDTQANAARELLSLREGIHYPRWSPSGNFIYFRTGVNGINGLYRVRPGYEAGGPAPTPELVVANVDFRDYTISRDGKKLLYQLNQNTEELWRLSMARPNDGQKARLLAAHTRFTPNLAVSPDGKMLALETMDGTSRALVLFDPERSTQRTLFAEQPAFAPSWSQDGRWIAFDAGGGNQADIWRISVTGETLEKIIEYPGADWMPTFSPTGDEICFLSNRGGQFDLWIQDLASGKISRLTRTPTIESGGYWSRRGNWLAYFRHAAADSGSSLMLFDLRNNIESELFRFPDRRIDILTKIVWAADDAAVYFDDGTGFARVDLRRGTLRYVLPGNGSRRERFRYDLYGDQLYLVKAQQSPGTIWMAEGLE